MPTIADLVGTPNGVAGGHKSPPDGASITRKHPGEPLSENSQRRESTSDAIKQTVGRNKK